MSQPVAIGSSPALLSPEECRSIVKSALQASRFEVESVSILPQGLGIGFMGDHWKIKILAKVQSSGSQCPAELFQLNLFGKSIPTGNEVHRNFVVSSGSYEKETRLYDHLLKVFNEFLTTPTEYCKTAAEETERCSVSCRSYFTRPDLLVLEDLSVLGFTQLSSRVPLNLAHCAALLKTMARFHAASIIYEEQRRRRLEPICSINQLHQGLLEESLFPTRDCLIKDWFVNSVPIIVAVAKLLPKFSDPRNQQMIDKNLPGLCHRVWELVKPSKTYRNVVCHGDMWTSNILFAYDDGDRERRVPIGVRLVDFQHARYAPPAHDVMFFLHQTTTRAFRQFHEQDLLRTYHGALGTELACHGLDCKKLLPWSELLDSVREQRLAGLVISAMFFPNALIESPEEELEERYYSFLQERTESVLRDFNKDSVFRSRMTETVDELVQYIY